jgi:trehalose/maltose hydrolase-like predicted phosphorylase
VRLDRAGDGHVYGVTGPDEYHEVVDDNAFTNVMARWHLRRAADLAETAGGATTAEMARWRRLADALVDGYSPETGLYEQFAGFHRLEPTLITDLATPPVAADLLLGPEVVHRSQITKQADVLMLHHMVPDEMMPGSLGPNIDFYGPRCAHGSSLSPAIHAAALARAGRPDEGLALFRIACRLDLDDLSGTTAGGLHLATMGGAWQALVYGFCGVRPAADSLLVDPHLPSAWDGVEVSVRYNGGRVRVRAGHDGVAVDAQRPLAVRVGADRRLVTLPAGTTSLELGSPS